LRITIIDFPISCEHEGVTFREGNDLTVHIKEKYRRNTDCPFIVEDS